MADTKEKESKVNKETKEEKKNTKKDSVKDPSFKQLYDIWGLLGQIEEQATFIRRQYKTRMVKDEARIMLTRIEMVKQIYLSDAEGMSDERSN